MTHLFNKIISWHRHRTMFVIADAADNSVTLSHRLFKHMGVMRLDVAKVFVFRIPEDNTYGFTINPDFAADTQVSDIMYNSKYKCIGFESLCPTVNRIFYDYGIPAGRKCRLSVEPLSTNGISYYKILPPNRCSTTAPKSSDLTP